MVGKGGISENAFAILVRVKALIPRSEHLDSLLPTRSFIRRALGVEV